MVRPENMHVDFVFMISGTELQTTSYLSKLYLTATYTNVMKNEGQSLCTLYQPAALFSSRAR